MKFLGCVLPIRSLRLIIMGDALSDKEIKMNRMWLMTGLEPSLRQLEFKSSSMFVFGFQLKNLDIVSQ